jgi:hypothetical protein
VPGLAKPVTRPELVIGRMDWSAEPPLLPVVGRAREVPGLFHQQQPDTQPDAVTVTNSQSHGPSQSHSQSHTATARCDSDVVARRALRCTHVSAVCAAAQNSNAAAANPTLDVHNDGRGIQARD